MNEKHEPEGVTREINRASHEGEGIEEAFRLTAGRMREMARRFISRFHVRNKVLTNQVVDDAWMKLFPPRPRVQDPPSDEDRQRLQAWENRPKLHWDHRGAFYLYLTWNMQWVLIDLLRKQEVPIDTTRARLLKAELLRILADDGVIFEELSRAANDYHQLARTLDDIFKRESVLRQLGRQTDIDPERFRLILARTLEEEDARDKLSPHLGDVTLLIAGVVDLITHRELIRLYLASVRREPIDPDDVPAGAAKPGGLTAASFMTLMAALEELDEVFLEKGAARTDIISDVLQKDIPSSSNAKIARTAQDIIERWRPREGAPAARVSLPRAVLELRFFAGCKRREVASFLGITEDIARHRLEDALDFLNDRLGSAFADFGLPADAQHDSAEEE